MNNYLPYISLVVTILLALLGYLVTYLNNLRLARRADRLKYIAMQLEELYGPLYVITQTGSILYEAYSKRSHDYNSKEKDIEWQLWVKNVFFPLNVELEKIIINKAFLTKENKLHPSILLFLAHNSGYKVLIEKWEKKDFSDLISVVPFPNEITSYAETTFNNLLKEYFHLMGQNDKR